ncbi:MAG: translocation/assembly module TamB domain-containing protein [Gemmatimonadaceae bacterium]
MPAERPRAIRVLQWTAVALAVLIAFAFTATLVLTSTDWGRERVRRFAVSQLENIVNGQVTIGRLRGNLLTGASIDAFAIRDSAGQPLLAAEQVSARYSILQLLARKIDMRSVRLVRPIVVLDRLPGGKWNYERIFPPSDSTQPADVRDRGFDWIVFHNVTVLDGRLIVRTPWTPDTSLSPASQDSSIRQALAGEKRIMVVPVANGFQKVVELRDLTARAPLVRITQPGYEHRLAQLASLQMVALPFRTPSANVHDLVGALQFDDDSLWWRDVAVRMPGSLLRGDGNYSFETGDLTIAARGRPVALADFRWVFPRFPSEGGGPLDFRLEWRGTTQEYVVQNADVRTQGARLRGTFAISFADTFAIHDTDVRFSNVNTTLVEQLVPGFESPRRGTLDGQLTVVGGRNAMQLVGNVAFHDPHAGTSRASGRGAVGYVNGDIRMRDLRLRVDPLQVALLKALSPDLSESLGPIGGTIIGNIAITGSTATSLALTGDVEHRDRGNVSRVSGRAGIRLAGATAFDVDVRAHTLSLAEVGLLAPTLGLRGSVSGPIRLNGTLGDLRIATTLSLRDGGVIEASGRLDLAEPGRSYDVRGRLRAVDLNSVATSAPGTWLNATVSARGSGFELATMQGTIAADIAASGWDGVRVDSGVVRVALSSGVARVQRLALHGAGTAVDAAGTFGLVAGRSGELRYSVVVESLGAYDRWIPGDREGVVRPRSALVASAFARARADSIRIARETAVERAATGRAMPRIPVDTPRALARSAVSGSLRASGTLRGNIRTFDAVGQLAANDVIARGNAARALRAEYAWTNARSRDSRLAVAVEGSQISVKGFAFDTLTGRLSYRSPTGEVQLAVRQGDERDYAVRGTFVLGERQELRVQALALRLDTTVWRLARAAVIHRHPAGVELHEVELRSNAGGLVYLNGMLPTEGNANLVLDVRNFQVADITGFAQSAFPLTGILTARGELQGTMSAPRFRGAVGLVQGNYNGSVIPPVQATLQYANASLTVHAEAVRDSAAPAAIADAILPINLAFAGVSGPRLLDLPMRVDVRGDSLPLDLVPAFTDLVEQIGGVASGRFAMRGTLKRPVLAGALAWRNGSLRVVPTGMEVNRITAAIRMARDTVFVDSLAGHSGPGTVRLTGGLYVGNWREPAFDLHLVADNAEVLDNDHGRLDADAGVSIVGPFRDAYVSGRVHVRSGVAYIPEPSSKQIIAADDPAIFAVMDTSVMSDRELFPVSSPLLEYLRVDVDLVVSRNTWLRSRDANIEMFTEEPLRLSRQADALAITGVVSTDRGEYTFLSKRFAIKRGSAAFVGNPDMNPTIQATGEYEVALAGRPAFNVRVLIGGTLLKPKLTLESDAQPPISQSDLLSYLAFGQSTTSLLHLEGSGLTGATATGNLVGAGAALAMKRMAAVALGVMADEVEGEATKGLGADVFNITPADVPTEFGGQSVFDFFQSTRIEAGKYLSPYFFMALQAQKYPGLRAEYRTPSGWRYEGSVAPRFLLRPPTLTIQRVDPTTSFGLFIIREWRF